MRIIPKNLQQHNINSLILNYKYPQVVLQSWKQALKSSEIKLKLIFIPLFFYLYSSITQSLNIYIQTRKGVILKDKLISLIPQFDFSTPIFLLLYSSLFLVIISFLHKPKMILKLIEMHIVIALVRQFCILLIALEPPHGLIILKDVFLENSFYPPFTVITKDLFFSGHVASIWLYFLIAQQKTLKTFLFLATILMSFMILSMRVHYSYDIYGAIIITTVIYKLPHWIKHYIFNEKLISETGK